VYDEVGFNEDKDEGAQKPVLEPDPYSHMRSRRKVQSRLEHAPWRQTVNRRSRVWWGGPAHGLRRC
jgi:hypothetical protein